MTRNLTFCEAVREAMHLCMEADPRVYTMGLGVPDPKGIFGTTLGLQEKYGDKRVLDMPCAENGMTGVAIGSALVGLRPIMSHQRVDFALVAMEQIVNQAAKWHYMFGGKMTIPIVIRMLIGRGWGQGPQHSQSLQAWFAHVPGLKVIMPTTPADAKGLLISAIEDNNPVIFLEHRWLYNISGPVPEGMHREPLGKCKIPREGSDLTVVAASHMTLEALRAAGILANEGVETEVIDLRSVRPLDIATVLTSVRKTGHLIVADAADGVCGVAGEIIAGVVEHDMSALKKTPCRLTLSACPTPTSPSLSAHYYPRYNHIIETARQMLGLPTPQIPAAELSSVPLDIPDNSFKGPF